MTDLPSFCYRRRRPELADVCLCPRCHRSKNFSGPAYVDHGIHGPHSIRRCRTGSNNFSSRPARVDDGGAARRDCTLAIGHACSLSYISRHCRIRFGRSIPLGQNVCPGRHILPFATSFAGSGRGPNGRASTGGNASVPNGHASNGARKRPIKFRGRQYSWGAAEQLAQRARFPILPRRPNPQTRRQTACAWCLSPVLFQVSPT